MNKKDTIQKILATQLYVVTDKKLSLGRSIEEVVESAILGGAGLIQYREKHLDNEKFTIEAKSVLDICNKYGVPLIINDRVEIAKEINAHGVHVGQDDNSIKEARNILGDNIVIGVSTHDTIEAKKAIAEGADYINIGPIYHTKTKQLPMDPIGEDMLKKVIAMSSVPVTTMGGINKTNIENVILCGADRCALVSAAVSADNITESCKELIRLIEKAKIDRH